LVITLRSLRLRELCVINFSVIFLVVTKSSKYYILHDRGKSWAKEKI